MSETAECRETVKRHVGLGPDCMAKPILVESQCPNRNVSAARKRRLSSGVPGNPAELVGWKLDGEVTVITSLHAPKERGSHRESEGHERDA